MLKLTEIRKIYGNTEDTKVEALKGININFREKEFVSILGPSGCGKTTLLNIIGGLDQYTTGDLIIKDKSTKNFNDSDWDTYRNHSIGFVFQSYNLIPHLTIIENVELSLQIGGITKSQRTEMAKEALIKVGLRDKMKKKPNELSGGQMQRVSIARAIVGNPDIILADEPTGALDTDTSIQVMELLKEIASDRLIVMVTHNPDLAYKYSTRIINMKDGNITGDSNPFDGMKENAEGIEIKRSKKQSSMNFKTAFKLSRKNLLGKRRRTLITSIAASIGTLGIALILSLSSGMQNYIDVTMADSTSFNYISISSKTTFGVKTDESDLIAYNENAKGIKPYKESTFTTKKQNLSTGFIEYLEEKTQGKIIDIAYTYNINMNILTKNQDKYVLAQTSSFSETLSNVEYVEKYYDVLALSDGASIVPDSANEICLVVDKYNRLSTSTLTALGISYDEDFTEIPYEDLLGKEYKVMYNNSWFTYDGTVYISPSQSNYDVTYEKDGITLKITSILREKKDAPASWLNEGLNYSPELTKIVLKNAKSSDVALAQYESKDVDVTTGQAFTAGNMSGMMFGGNSNTYESTLEKLGYTQTPYSITIYPKDVEARKEIISELDSWNEVKSIEDTTAVVEYTDMSSMMTSLLSSVVNVVTYVLLAFSIISLVISSIMIAIIIYASVIERTKEIGVLRSLGARKKDVGRIFNAEAVILGLISGTIAIGVCYILDLLINAILKSLLGVAIAYLPISYALLLIALSIFLLLIASIIPAKLASKKDPVIALRTE